MYSVHVHLYMTYMCLHSSRYSISITSWVTLDSALTQCTQVQYTSAVHKCAKQVQQHNLRAGCASGATACTLRGISSVGSPSPGMQDRHFLHGGHVLALAFRSHCQRRNWWRSITTFKINLKRACTVSCLNITCFAIC